MLSAMSAQLTLPTLRHYLYWIAACACTPLALAQLSDYFSAIDFQPRYLFVPPLTLHNILIDALTIGVCLVPPLLQWRALRGLSPDLAWWQWLPLAWGALLLHTLLFQVGARTLHMNLQIDGRQLASLLTTPDYSIPLSSGARRLPASLAGSALLYLLFQALLPALLLARRCTQKRQVIGIIVAAALAGSLAGLAAQWQQAASGVCLFASPGGVGMLANLPFAILVLSRAAIGTLEGAVGVATLAWLLRRTGAALPLRRPTFLLAFAIVLNLVLQPALASLVHAMGPGDMPC